MAWGDKKITRDDTSHPTPRKLPPNGWSKPEQRAADAAIEALNESTSHEMDGLTRRGCVVASFADERGPVDLSKFEHEMTRDRIADIKAIVCKLTYGEMMTVAELLADAMPSGTVDKDQFKFILPPTLHAWATSTPQNEISAAAS